MTDTNISGQGYLYGSDPKATNPFYGKEESGGGGAAPDKYVKSATIVEGENSNALKLRTVTVENGTSRTTDSTEWNITGEKGERGEQGEPGAKGEQGEAGKDGVTPDITATATVSQTTGTASVTVTKTGTKEAPKFNFAFSGIKGEKGEGGSGGTGGGEKGDKGDPGEPGKAATISVGTTTTGAPGSNAAVTNTGTENAAVLNFTIPRGEKGEKGDTGATGATGEAGAPGAKGEQGEPGTPGAKGDPGEPGKAATISVGTTTTGAPGSNAAVTNTGTENAAVLNFTIPKGEKGDTGADGAPGAKGDPGDPVSKAGLMTDVSMTNENGIYTFKQTKYNADGTATAESEIGTVEVSGGGSSTPGIVEVKDTVVENNTNGYDFHTITETENDGTENEVGKFYIAQRQICEVPRSPDGVYWPVKTIDQNGNVTQREGQRFGTKYYTLDTITIPDYVEGKHFFITIYAPNSVYPKTYIPIPTFSDKTQYRNGTILAVVPNYVWQDPYASYSIQSPCTFVFFVNNNQEIRCAVHILWSGMLAQYVGDIDAPDNLKIAIEVL